MRRVLFALLILSLPIMDASAEKSPKVKYKKGKDINFESLLIEGQIKRPDISIVTGNKNESIKGLLKLREDFLDEIALDSGEELK